MAKQLVGQAKFQVPGGQATPAPPVGTSLGKFGINLGQFVHAIQRTDPRGRRNADPRRGECLQRPQFRLRHQESAGRGAAEAGGRIAKGSGVPNKEKVGKVTKAQVADIVKLKMADLNARDVEHAARMVEGTARSMGITVEGLAGVKS